MITQTLSQTEEVKIVRTQECSDWFRPKCFLLLIVAALCACFGKILLGLDTLFYRDFGAQVYPTLHYLRQSLLRGELPVWNPLSHCGVPFMAQWGHWYPFLFLSPLFPMPWFVNFLQVAHLFWGAWGMYWLCRKWGVSGVGASFAGVAYALNGISLGCLMWVSYTASLAWLPWTAGLTMQAWRSGGKWTGRAALASAMQVLAGAPEVTLLFWVCLGLLWLDECRRKEIQFWKSFNRLLCVVGVAAGITAVQMLPFFDLLSQSQRNRNFGDNGWSMPGWGWANLFLPLFHCYEAPQGLWFQPGQDLLNSYYLGLSVLALGIFGALANRNSRNTLLAIIAVLCWVMALGSDGYIFAFAKRVFPLIGIARFPIKFAVLPAFLVPLLAASGLDKAVSEKQPRWRLLASVVAGFLALMSLLLWFARAYPFPSDNWNATALNGLWRALLLLAAIAGLVLAAKYAQVPTIRSLLLLSVVALLPIDALTHSPNLAPTVPSWNVAPGLWTASGNQPPPKLAEGRLMLSPAAEQRLFYGSVPDRAMDFTRKRLSEWYNLNLLDEIPKLTGAMILRPRHFDLIENYAYYTPGARLNDGLLDALAVTSISSTENPTAWIERTNCPPLVTAGQQPAFASEEDTLKAMSADGFNPRTTVFLPQNAASIITVTNQSQCTVLGSQVSAGKAQISVRANQPSMVVISQTFYHWWQASVDGHPVPLLRANLAFQAVQVPPGDHQLTLVYKDYALWLGACISTVSAILCGWLMRQGDGSQPVANDRAQSA